MEQCLVDVYLRGTYKMKSNEEWSSRLQFMQFLKKPEKKKKKKRVEPETSRGDALTNCEDNSSFDFICAFLIWFISCTSVTFISFTRTYEQSSAQLVRASHRYREVTGSIPLKSWILFMLLTQLYDLRSQLRGSFFIWFNFRSSYMISSYTSIKIISHK